MKTFRLVAASFVFAAFLAVSAFAQAAAPTTRIGLVNTFVFEDPKAGITKLVTASTSLEGEFKTPGAELQTMYTKIQTLENELKALQKQVQDGKVPVAQQTVSAKSEEYEKLGRDFKFKQEDLKARLDRRRQTVVGPVWLDVMKAMQSFAKEKGYAVILDGTKLEEAGILMAFDEKHDVTKEFIAFYNARPAGTTAAAK
ncbi:MAG: OmpH family outer membrane protein [Pyrinomonadaceae bacterium]|jgi:Skp family chaperone for outer membrane proteins|nr:OmpH family outer membrane protein [Acidobacteriota bacterium]